MKIALIVIGVIVAIALAVEIVGWIVAKRGESRWKRMSSEERRKYQQDMYKASHWANSSR